ncbi:four helix bundle protein [Candidatus Saccharibacteria bacterium]|nr:four helix bundle protein [Candidatus Saccharibacteria bacterium]
MTIYQDKLQALEQRTVDFSISGIAICRPLIKDFLLRPVCEQLVRAATSVGANYSEANNASSKADFRNKIFIAKKEVNETRYWLKVLSGANPDLDVSATSQEALELNLIFQKVISSLKSANEK